MESPEYEGGWFYDGTKSLGRAWLPAYRERWTKMLHMLGREFDAHPDLAAVMLSESSGLFSTKNRPSSWSLDGIMAFAAETFATMTEHFAKTPFFQYVNWGLDDETREAFMTELVEKNAHGFGGPDIINSQPKWGKSKYVLDNVFGSYYEKYRGVAAFCVENRPSGYFAHDARTIFNYAVDEVGVHFLPWSAYTKKDRAWTIFDAIQVVNAEKGRINTAPPSNVVKKQ
jgi:hypothetical protein